MPCAKIKLGERCELRATRTYSIYLHAEIINGHRVIGGVGLLTESQVQKSFRGLFAGGSVTEDDITKGEQLLEELRPESPLRHRLSDELEELRRLIPAN